MAVAQCQGGLADVQGQPHGASATTFGHAMFILLRSPFRDVVMNQEPQPTSASWEAERGEPVAAYPSVVV